MYELDGGDALANGRDDPLMDRAARPRPRTRRGCSSRAAAAAVRAVSRPGARRPVQIPAGPNEPQLISPEAGPEPADPVLGADHHQQSAGWDRRGRLPPTTTPGGWRRLGPCAGRLAQGEGRSIFRPRDRSHITGLMRQINQICVLPTGRTEELFQYITAAIASIVRRRYSEAPRRGHERFAPGATGRWADCARILPCLRHR